jgi:hypothetical protein
MKKNAGAGYDSRSCAIISHPGVREYFQYPLREPRFFKKNSSQKILISGRTTMGNKLLQHGAISWFQLMIKVMARGGKLIVPPTDIPHIGRFSVFSDPQEAVISTTFCFPHQP